MKFPRLSGLSTGARGLAGRAKSTGGRATMGVHKGLAGGGAFMSRNVINRSLFFH